MSDLKHFEHLKIQLEAVIAATNNFSDECLIGKGGFGKVYKGEIVHSEGKTVAALKRLDRIFGQGDPQFWKEIMMLSQYKHTNIVSLLGYCDDGGEKILVYEYAPKKSLDRYLNSSELTWVQRLKICIGVAKGLAYLHDAAGTTQQRILHRDIKSSNIILDDNWNAKIADFGLSKFGPANQEFTFMISEAVGTHGYVDPLYVETGLLTKESDVFSFGVVLFEVLCGRLCFGHKDDKNQPLIGLVRQSYKENRIKEIICDNIKDEIDRSSIQVFVKIAYQCLERERQERPKMSLVVTRLETALQCQIKGSPKKSDCWKFFGEDDFYLLNRSTCHPSTIGVQNLKVIHRAIKKCHPSTIAVQNLKVRWIGRAIKKFAVQLYTKTKETRPPTFSLCFTPGPSTSIQGWSPLCRHFKFSEIQSATKNFDKSLVTGKGAFGTVYKGDVMSGSTLMGVAIKRHDQTSNQGAEEFRAELELLPTLRHCNIVPLIGYCNYGEEMILVYEYIPNGSLYEHLYELGTPLSWIQRLKICIGTARGLHYLQCGIGIKAGVIHRDVKSSNIMLNESWEPKITDFGSAMKGPTDDQPFNYVSDLVRGTIGFLDPDYFRTGRVSMKSDVYSFGMVLLEVLCRKRAFDASRSLKTKHLAAWFKDCIRNGELHDIPDFEIRHQIAPNCLKQFARIADRCLHQNPEDRPTMAEVLLSLESLLFIQGKYNDSPQDTCFEEFDIVFRECDRMFDREDSCVATYFELPPDFSGDEEEITDLSDGR